MKSGLPDDLNYSILITGGNTTPVTVTYDDINAMGFVEKDQVVMVKSNGVLGFKREGTALTDDVSLNPIQLLEPGEPGSQWIKMPIKIEIEKA